MLLKFALLSLVFLNTSCAENATSPLRNTIVANEHEAEEVFLSALKYEGTEPISGKVCSLYLGQFDDHGNKKWAIFNDENIHGESISPLTALPYKYEDTTQLYHKVLENIGSYTLKLVAIKIEDEHLIPNPNQIDSYKNTGNLIQSSIIDFKSQDWTAFSTALDSFTNNNSEFENLKNELNLIKKVIFSIKHFGHYDSIACLDLELIEYKELSINLDHGNEHGEDDHNH